MCGIIGYVGDEEKTLGILVEGLKRLEYRGYDSSGIALLENGRARIIKSEGKLTSLIRKIEGTFFRSPIGIGHTRWATHGSPSERNAHPHTSGSTLVVHNGIIENYLELKEGLEKKGYRFSSDTDTEVIAHLIEDFSGDGLSLEEAVRRAFRLIEGSYAVVVISEREPGRIIGVRKFSPLILGVGEGEGFIASDIPAILPYTKRVVFLEDGDIAVADRDGFRITELDGKLVKREIKTISWDPIAVEKAGYKHFMLKEIHEQPRALLNTIRGRISEEAGEVSFEGLEEFAGDIGSIRRVVALACGTSYHACLVGKYMIEKLARIPVEVDLASEFRYRDTIVDGSVLGIAVSQSGETADTSEAVIEAKERGAKTLAICNVPGSKIARECDSVIYTHAGPEIGVASTKAFTTQLIVFYLLAIYLGRHTGRLSPEEGRVLIKDAFRVPQFLERALKGEKEIEGIAEEFYSYRNFLYLGRGISYPIALEGALKLKEISYIHAEGYAAGEMKHGPIALIDESMPVVLVAPKDGVMYRKILGNLQEIKARDGKIIALISEEDKEIRNQVDRFIEIPYSPHFISPIVSIIPLQLFAYYIALSRGTDVDQPRNLAKVVTVE